MKVKELIEKLKKVDPEIEIFCTSNTGEYDYGLANTAKVKTLSTDGDNYNEDEDEEITAFVIDEQ